MKKSRQIKKNIFRRVTEAALDLLYVFSYILLIFVYFAFFLFRKLSGKIKFLTPVVKLLENLIEKLDGPKQGRVPRIELIRLAGKNMVAKKNRTLVTIGGIAVGIGAIVFMVSIGYGLQSMVVDRVSSLEEMKQADVSVLPGSNLFINDETVNDFSRIPYITHVLPQIAVVGKVNYKNSLTDVAVYGVTSEYLNQSAISPVLGNSFESDLIIDESIEIIKEYAYETEMDDEPLDEYLTDEWIELEGESEIPETLRVTQAVFPDNLNGTEAVVNRAFLRVLGLQDVDAVGERFSIKFISTGRISTNEQNKIESSTVEYTIVGVTPDDLISQMYVPISHLRAMGIENYSQIKIVVDQEEYLVDSRQIIEAQGFATSSVVDTVEQINNLFSTIRLVLGLFGAIALFVASLGMFNTLTVSLLERTREIGLLKAMGMKSREVRDLFLAESMIMGTFGGVSGIIIGVLLGKIIELGLGVYAVSQGAGGLKLVQMPFLFASSIILLAFTVGILTGLYPARRATKISALNALRYE